MSLKSNIRKFNLAPLVPEMTIEQTQNEIMTVKKLIDYQMGSYSPVDLTIDKGRQTIKNCSSCKTFTKHEVKSKFSGAPEILAINFKQIKHQKVTDFVEQIMIFNTKIESEKRLSTLEKEFLEDTELEILDQEMVPNVDLLETFKFEYVEDSSDKPQDDRNYKKLF